MPRRSVHEQITVGAMNLLSEQCVSSTTVEQLAEASGIQSRTFFGDFPTKEDVVIGDPVPPGIALQHAREERPLTGEPWAARRRAMDVLIGRIRAAPVLAVQKSSMMIETPGLRGRIFEKQLIWQGMRVPNMVERIGSGHPDGEFRASARVSSMRDCFDAALVEWARVHGKRRIEDFLDEAIDAVRK